jgi:hypothetical protein
MGSDDQAEDMERYRRAVELALDELDSAIAHLHAIRKEVRSPVALGQSVLEPPPPAQSSAGAGVIDRRRWSSAARRGAAAAKDSSEKASGGNTAGSADSAKQADQLVTPEVRKVARQAALVVLTLVGKKAATGLTKQLATKWPEMYRQFIEPRVEEAGGINELAKRVTDPKGLKGVAVGMAAESVLDRFTGGKRSRKPDDTGHRRRPAATVPVATSNSAQVPRGQARPASSQSSGAAPGAARDTRPTRKAPSGATKEASAPPARVPSTPAKTASSTRKTTSRRTSR